MKVSIFSKIAIWTKYFVHDCLKIFFVRLCLDLIVLQFWRQAMSKMDTGHISTFILGFITINLKFKILLGYLEQVYLGILNKCTWVS